MTTILFPPDINKLLDDDDYNYALRALLIDPDDSLRDIFDDRIRLIERNRIYNILAPLSDHDLSQLRLALSICPLHHCDYAICFDDDDDECAAIRTCFPSHDT